MAEGGLGRYFFLLAFSWRPCRNAKGSEREGVGTTNFRHHWLIYFVTDVISILVPRYVLQIYVFYSHCLSNSTCLVESSNQWNYIFNTISSAISTWMLKEMSRIRGSNAIISGNTLRPALAASFFFAWSAGRPLSHKVSLVHDDLSSKIDWLGSK